MNVYRCRFGIDTGVVPGGCRQGVPALPAKGPDTWVRGEAGSSIGEELLKRDGLIAAQEALLNVYRCRFDIDTDVVEGGCRDTTAMLSATSPGWYPDPTCRHDYRFWNGGNDLGGWSHLVKQQDGEQLEDYFTNVIQDSVPLSGNDADCIQAGVAEYLPPGERLSSLSIGNLQMCLLRVDGTLTCKGKGDIYSVELFGEFSDGRLAVLTDQFLAVSVGDSHSCAVRVDQTVLCWRANGVASGLISGADVQLDAPTGRYTAVSAGGGWFSCGLKVDQTIVCWGSNDKGQTAAPPGHYTAVSAGYGHSCGVRADQAIVCWGDNAHGELKAPTGRFTMVSAGFGFSCGLKVDQTIVCWGSEAVPIQDDGDSPLTSNRDFNTPNAFGELDAPSGSFTAVSASTTYACGLRADAAIECWGSGLAWEGGSPNKFVLTSRHPRQFTAISTGDSSVCGVRADGTAECYWTYVPYLNWYRFPRTGLHDIHVFYCASIDAGYTEADLEDEVKRLTRTVGEFFFRESSGLASIRFLSGGILTPELPWRSTERSISLPEFRRNCFPNDGTYDSTNIKIGGAYPKLDVTYLVLLDGEISSIHGSSAGIALPSDTSEDRAAVSTIEQFGSTSIDFLFPYTLGGYIRVATHEIGHATFDLLHPPDCSVMGIGYFKCPQYLLDAYTHFDSFFDSGYIGCRDRRILGWPEDNEQCKEPLRRRLPVE